MQLRQTVYRDAALSLSSLLPDQEGCQSNQPCRRYFDLARVILLPVNNSSARAPAVLFAFYSLADETVTTCAELASISPCTRNQPDDKNSSWWILIPLVTDEVIATFPSTGRQDAAQAEARRRRPRPQSTITASAR
jgi:hypothetical protein